MPLRVTVNTIAECPRTDCSILGGEQKCNVSLPKGRAIAQTVNWPVCHREGMASVPGQYVCDLWWTEWHCERFVSQYFGLPLSVLFQQCFILNFI